MKISNLKSSKNGSTVALSSPRGGAVLCLRPPQSRRSPAHQGGLQLPLSPDGRPEGNLEMRTAASQCFR